MDLAVTRIGSSSCPLRDIIAEIRFLASTYMSWDFWKKLGFCPNQGGRSANPKILSIFSKTKSEGGGSIRAVESEFKSNPIFYTFIRYFLPILSDFYLIFIRFFPIFRLFLTFRLADSTALVQQPFM